MVHLFFNVVVPSMANASMILEDDVFESQDPYSNMQTSAVPLMSDAQIQLVDMQTSGRWEQTSKEIDKFLDTTAEFEEINVDKLIRALDTQYGALKVTPFAFASEEPKRKLPMPRRPPTPGIPAMLSDDESSDNSSDEDVIFIKTVKPAAKEFEVITIE